MGIADRKPIVWAFSGEKLSQLLQAVLPEYGTAADIRILPYLYDDALTMTRKMVQAGEEVDVLVAAGSNGAYLHQHAGMPVVMIEPTGFDIFLALATARRMSSRIALVTFPELSPELAQFMEVYGLPIEQRAYVSRDDAAASVRELAARGVEVVVGTTLATDLAEQAGLRGVFLYTRNTLRQAIGQAIEIARIARIEEAKRERLDAILRHLHEGVVAVDMEERIQSLNPAMEKLLGVAAKKALGTRLSTLAPGLGLSRVLENGSAELEGIQKLGTRTLVANRIPLWEQGARTGAVLTCQDASAIERVDRSLRSEHRPRRFVARHELSAIVGDSPATVRVRELAARYARTDATVLITGASGTGKELCAQGIHNASPRRDLPFVPINCAAFPETLLESELFGYEEGAFTGSRRGGKAGLFEAAHTGTIFLDEVGDVPLALQTRLLRVLQEREVLRLGSNDPTPIDVRVIAATNRDLKRLVAEGVFREDLYYRLNILHLHLAPLAARREDIAAIATRLLERALQRYGVLEKRDQVLARLLPRLRAYSWPGNVREIENVLERVAVLYADSAVTSPTDPTPLSAVIPELYQEIPPAGQAVSLKALRRESDRARIQQVIEECRGNQAEAARRLGIGRTTLWRRLNGRA